METDSIAKSIEMAKTVRGVEVRRAAFGQYLKIIDRLRKTPGELKEILRVPMATATLPQTIDALLGIAPELFLDEFAQLSGVPRERLENDPEIGLDGLYEIVRAWVEINNIKDFINAVRPTLASLTTSGRAATIFSGLSRRD
jgi:hypothetical protein